MELCYLQNINAVFDEELFRKFSSYVHEHIQHFNCLQIILICKYVQDLYTYSSSDSISAFCTSIETRLEDLKKMKEHVMELKLQTEWRKFFQPNIINVADHIYIIPYQNILDEDNYQVLDAYMFNISNLMNDIKTHIRMLYVYYSRYINHLIHRSSLQKHLLIKYELTRKSKMSKIGYNIFIDNEFLYYLELKNKIKLWSLKLNSLNADPDIISRETLDTSEHINIILYKYFDILFNFKYELPVSVIEESKTNENLSSILKKDGGLR